MKTILPGLIALAAIPFASSTLKAQNSQAATATSSARAETQLSKTVAFITLVLNSDKPKKPGERDPTADGTGLWVAVPDPRLPVGKSFNYLVTNRHVAEGIDHDEKGNCKPLSVKQTYVSLNLKEPVNGERLDKIPLTPHWHFPADQAIDLAAMLLAPSNAKYDYRNISIDDFLTSDVIEKRQVVPGDRVLTTGYFYHYEGLHQIQPIVREGVLAMLPDGPMITTTCKAGRLYLADVHVTPGNSGSPLFVIPALGLGAGEVLGGVPSTFGLLGIISGYMYESNDLILRASTTWKGSVNGNSGISVVVPAEQLKDLLNSPALQRERDEVFSAHQ